MSSSTSSTSSSAVLGQVCFEVPDGQVPSASGHWDAPDQFSSQHSEVVHFLLQHMIVLPEAHVQALSLEQTSPSQPSVLDAMIKLKAESNVPRRRLVVTVALLLFSSAAAAAAGFEAAESAIIRRLMSFMMNIL